MIDLAVIIFIIIWVIAYIYNAFIENNVWNVVLAVLFLIIGLWMAVEADKNAYKKGQIDALNGKYKYEIQVKPDTTYKYLGD